MFSKNTAQCPGQSSNPECLIRSSVQLPTNSTYGYWANNLLGQQTKLLGGGGTFDGQWTCIPSKSCYSAFLLHLFLTSDYEGQRTSHFFPWVLGNNFSGNKAKCPRRRGGWYHRWAMDNIPSRGGSNSLKSLVLQKPEIRIIIRIASFPHI